MSSQHKRGRKDNQDAVVGCDRSFRFVLYDYDHNTETYSSLDISGGSGTMKIYQNYSETAGFTSEVSKWEKSISLVDAANGICKTVYEDTDFLISDVGQYYYQLEFTDSGGNNYRPVWGVFTVSPS